MRMRFDVNVPGDEEAAEAAREEMVAEFKRWLDANPGRSELEGAEPWDVDLLLGWKWGYGDGDYGLWTRADVDEVLLDHLPQKLSAPPDAAASIPSSLAALVRFLDDRGLLDADSDPADAVAGRALAQQRAFLDAMDDPASFGMAKRLFSSLGIDGKDLPDQAALDAAIARFNDLPFDQRGEVLGFDGPDPTEAGDLELPRLPLQAMPPPAVIDSLAGDVPLLRKVDAFTGALDPSGELLTKAGNLTIADGRRLATATGVGDRVEGIRSTTAMPELFAVGQVAQRAGAVEVAGNRLRPVEAWVNEPVAIRWQRVVDAAIEAGAATLAFGASVPMPIQLAELADQMTIHLLAMLWLAGEPVRIDAFVDMIGEAADLDTPFGALVRRDHTRSVCRDRIDDVLATLGEAGVVVTDGDDRVALTEAGATLAAPTLREAGFGVLLPDEVAKLDAAGLIDVLIERDGDDVAAAAQLWADGPVEGRASGALVGELSTRPDPARVMVGFSVLQHLGPDATDAVRRLTEGPLAGHAWLFLVDQGAADPEDVPPDVLARTGVDLFVATADLGSPADVVEMFLCNVPAGEHSAFIDTLVATNHPRTGELLELVGRHHPDKKTAKHARKAAHRWRSQGLDS
ncbi:MAG TPA: hypothetical protein VKA65_09920 [Acidimicrobiales bacterium]|nr:hypothetical protein [Acidimicrobiales bacterium]